MEKLFNNIYEGKKVLVTGHTGFKGSWLSLWLTKLGAEVIGYSVDIPTTPNHFKLLKLKMTSIIDDVLDKKKVEKVINKHKPDIIFHMAAQPIVRKSYEIPVETIETNVMGTVNILESVRKNGNVKAVVVITSDKCYQNKELKRGYHEEDAMGGDDPYSASKGAAEIVANSYRTSFFNIKNYGTTHNTLIANVRAGNVIGGGDWAQDRLIPDIVRATSKGEKVNVRNPKATRPWQHVLEPLSGYLLVGARLLEGKKEFAENWNFGPSDNSALSVHEVVLHSKKHWGTVDYHIEVDAKKLHEARLLALDSTKARTKLKWQSVWNEHTTFEKTITWYKNYYTKSKVESEKDLIQYTEDAKKLLASWTRSWK